MAIKPMTTSLDSVANCYEVLLKGGSLPGVYSLQLDEVTEVYAHCLADGWTVFQSRGQFGNPDDFFLKEWTQYEDGFGTPGNLHRVLSFLNQNSNSKPGKEHWLGLKAINKITASGTSMQLKIEMEKFDGTSSYAQYDDFLIKDQVMQVLISLCTYHQ